jgi:hypothetical protein
MVKEYDCLQHSGVCEALDTCKKNDETLFKKFDEIIIEIGKIKVTIAYYVGGASVVTAVLVVALQKLFH